MLTEKIKKILTEDEIIEVLNACRKLHNCDRCKYSGNYIILHSQEILDIINNKNRKITELMIENDHQKAKNKELEERNVVLRGLVDTQQAEIKEKQELIDRLHEVNEQLYEEMSERQKEEVRVAKKYAVLMFADRLKGKYLKQKGVFVGRLMYADEIDNLVKEMVGEE